MGQLAQLRAPAREIADQIAERRGGPAAVSSSRVEDAGGGEAERDALGAGEQVELRHRLVAEAALGRVDDPLEGEVVGGLGDDAQISERVADLGALVEAEAADDAVGQADRDEPVFELAGLELGADEDRGTVEAGLPAALDRFELVADAARLLGPVPDADHLDLLALVLLGPQGLAEPAAILRDQARGGGEDVRGRAVILFEPDDLRAREILLEPQDIGRPPRRARSRSTDRRRRRSRCSCAPARAGGARDIGPGWCPDIRRRGCSGSAAGSCSSTSRWVFRITSMWSSRSPKSQALSVAQARLIERRRAWRPCRWR